MNDTAVMMTPRRAHLARLPMQAKLTAKVEQCIALALYDRGLNIGVQPHGKKEGFPWKCLYAARLDREGLEYLVTQFKVNPAVIVGRTSHNLFVIDCETPAAFERERSELLSRSIRFWSVKTSRGGHIWLFSRDGEIANIPSGKLADMEVRGSYRYVLIPGAVHPDGTIYQWRDFDGGDLPTVSLAQLDHLPLKLSTCQSGTVYTPDTDPLECLSKRNREFLQSGASHGERDERLFAAVCDLIANDFPEDQIETLAYAAAEKCLPPLSDYVVGDKLKSAYSKPRKPAKKRRARLDRNPVWQQALTWTLTHAWTGRTAATDRAVCLALCERARTANATGVFRASSREVAEIANVGLATTQRAIARLVRAGVLVDVSTEKRRTSRAIRFSKDVCQSGTVSIDPKDFTVPLWHVSHDLADPAALGRTAFAVWRDLTSNGPSSVPHLAARIGVTRRTIRRAITRLTGAGLASPNGDSYTAAERTDGELQLLAAQYGIAGKSRERAERFERDRAAYAFKVISSAVSKYHRGRQMFVQLSQPAVEDRRLPEPTKAQIALSGAELYRQRQAIKDNNRRDDWYQALAAEDRQALIEYIYGPNGLRSERVS